MEPAWQLSELEMSVRMLLSLRSKEPLMLAGAAPPGWLGEDGGAGREAGARGGPAASREGRPRAPRPSPAVGRPLRVPSHKCGQLRPAGRL